MLQRFGTDTIPTHFVKYIVEQNEIPMIPFTKNVLHVVNGRSYIHNNYIVRCKKSGFTPQITSLNETTYFDFIEPYIFGRRYAGLTSKYLSRTRYYDSETHSWLGNYLRAYKAVYDINLMYYYNCFSNEYCQKISIETPTTTYKYYKLTNQNLENETYKIISVPIKFCQKYTVAIQSEEGALFIPAFVGPLGLLDKQQSLLQDYINTCLTSQRDDCEYTSISDFKQPITYFNKPFIFQSPCFGNEERDTTYESLVDYEKYLRLLILVPQTNTSSVVVLEGVYSNIQLTTSKIVSTSKDDIEYYINTLSTDEEKQLQLFEYKDFTTYLNNNLYNNLSLLRCNCELNFAFSYRLIEYLCNNVITHQESISQNVKIIQEALGHPLTGIWTDDLRLDLFFKVNDYVKVKNKFLTWDSNGYLDKDTEALITTPVFKSFITRG